MRQRAEGAAVRCFVQHSCNLPMAVCGCGTRTHHPNETPRMATKVDVPHRQTREHSVLLAATSHTYKNPILLGSPVLQVLCQHPAVDHLIKREFFKHAQGPWQQHELGDWSTLNWTGPRHHQRRYHDDNTTDTTIT